MKKKDVLTLNAAWNGVKVKGLSKESTLKYLTLRTKLTEEAETVGETIEKARKTVLEDSGYKDGDKIPADKAQDVTDTYNGVVKSLLDEEVELDTKILTADELFDAILSNEANDGITTEAKAVLMKFLIK